MDSSDTDEESYEVHRKRFKSDPKNKTLIKVKMDQYSVECEVKEKIMKGESRHKRPKENTVVAQKDHDAIFAEVCNVLKKNVSRIRASVESDTAQEPTFVESHHSCQNDMELLKKSVQEKNKLIEDQCAELQVLREEMAKTRYEHTNTLADIEQKSAEETEKLRKDMAKTEARNKALLQELYLINTSLATATTVDTSQRTAPQAARTPVDAPAPSRLAVFDFPPPQKERRFFKSRPRRT